MKNNKSRLTAAFLTVCIIALMAAPLTAQAATVSRTVINNSVNGLSVSVSYDDFMLINKLYPGETDTSVMTIRNTLASSFTLDMRIVEIPGNTDSSKPNLANKVNLKVTSGGDSLLETQNYRLWTDPADNTNTVRIPSNYILYDTTWADPRDVINGILNVNRLYPIYPDEETEIMGGLLNVDQTYSLGTFNNTRNLALNFEASLLSETGNEYQGAQANFQVIFTVQTIPYIPPTTYPTPTEPTPTTPTEPITEPATSPGFIGSLAAAADTAYEAEIGTSTPIQETQPIIEEEYIPDELVPLEESWEEENIPEDSVPLAIPSELETLPPTIIGSVEEPGEDIPDEDIPLSNLPVTGGIALTGMLIAGIALLVLGKVVEGKKQEDKPESK